MKKRYILLIDGALLVLVILAAVLSRWMLGNMPPCAFLRYGVKCPACGGTRCVKFSTQGNLAAAFLVNPYLFCTGIAALGLLLLVNIAVLSGGRKGGRLLKSICRPWLLVLWSVGFVLFGIIRNFI